MFSTNQKCASCGVSYGQACASGNTHSTQWIGGTMVIVSNWLWMGENVSCGKTTCNNAIFEQALQVAKTP